MNPGYFFTVHDLARLAKIG